MDYQIIPLKVGTITDLPKQALTHRMNREVVCEGPCIMWYIQGTKNNIIVDLGPSDPDQFLENHGLHLRRTENEKPANALKTIGLSTDEVKIVIITHLHFDHAWGFHIFKNAKFLIQEKEIHYAITPLPTHRASFYETSLGKPQFVDYLDRIEAIRGDYEVEEGVNAILIPSHTPGFQGVLVNTKKGKYFIAGDAVGLFECWETTPHITSGTFNSLEDYRRSLEKIEKIADYVLPGHDMKVFDKPIYP